MAPGADGKLYVVAGLAHNETLGDAQARATPTGFVSSRLFVVEDVGTATAHVLDRDLNRSPAGAVVAKNRAVSMPTSIALLQSGSTVQKVFITGFGNDRIAVLPTRAAGRGRS
jgi:hypothetical protein